MAQVSSKNVGQPARSALLFSGSVLGMAILYFVTLYLIAR